MKRFILLLSLVGLVPLAGAVDPVFTQTIPAGGQIGTEVEVEFRGSRLADAKEILYYHKGIETVEIREAKNDSVKALLKIAPDCRLGEHHLRVRTATGLTQLQTFWVGPFPTEKEKEPNNEISKAQKIPLNVTVEGVADREDVDYYIVEAKQGQTLSVEVEGMRLGRVFFDPYVAIQDLAGKILAESDDTALFLQDPAVSFVIPQDGAYIVQVRESSYAGNNRCVYRMHVGTFQRPQAIFPPGGQAGQSLEVAFIDKTGDSKQSIQLPAEPVAKFGANANRDGVLTPSPSWMRVSPFPNVLEVEPNNDLKTATPAELSLPAAFNGIISQKGDADWFRFKAKKDEVFEVNVYAQRIRSPLDSVLNIYDANGRSIAGNDDTGGSDSYLRFTAPADGDYHLRITDHLGRGGPDYTYRVEFTPVEPSHTLVIPHVARFDSQSRQVMVVPRGNRFATLISATRNNFRGDVAFHAENLPAGVKLHAAVMPNSQNSAILVFEAAPDAELGASLVDLTARQIEGEKEKDIRGGFRQVLDLVMSNPNNTVYYQTEIDRLVVAVTDEAPFSIRIEQPQVPIAQYGSMNLKVIADRKPGFDEAINVELPYRPPGVNANPRLTIPKGAGSADYLLNANANAETREWKIGAIASAAVGGGTLWVASPLINLEVAPRFVLGQFQTTTAEQGQTVKVVCKLDQKVPFEGKATLELLGLPANTTASKIEITSEDKEAVFDVVTTEKSTVGLHKTLFCNLVITKSSEPITHTIANGGILRIDAAKAKTASTGAVNVVVAQSK